MLLKTIPCALLLLMLCAPARAGLLDSPPPLLDGSDAAKVVYRLGPYYYEPGWVDTVVTCRNLANTPVTVALDVYDDTDALVSEAMRSGLPPAGVVAFTSSVLADIASDEAVSGLPPVANGKARISATSTRLACTAMHRLRDSQGVLKEAPVELLKKVGRGDG